MYSLLDYILYNLHLSHLLWALHKGWSLTLWRLLICEPVIKDRQLVSLPWNVRWRWWWSTILYTFRIAFRVCYMSAHLSLINYPNITAVELDFKTPYHTDAPLASCMMWTNVRVTVKWRIDRYNYGEFIVGAYCWPFSLPPAAYAASTLSYSFFVTLPVLIPCWKHQFISNEE